MQNFSKYDEQGAYHWRVADGNPMRRSPRLRARYSIALRLLRRRLRLKGSFGIDAGCGDGLMTHMLERKGARVLGCDASEEGLRLARREIRKRGVSRPWLVRSDCYEMPVPDATADFVVSLEVIEHLKAPGRFLSEVVRVLKPGGHFVCSTPNREEGQGRHEVRDPYHVKEYDPEELAAELRDVFPDAQVFGAHPAWLDRLYLRGGDRSWMARAARAGFRLAAGVTNPYLHAVSNRPGTDSATLFAVASKWA